MTGPRMKRIATFLVVILVFNFILFGFAGSAHVEAGLWDNPKDGLFTVLKGLVMLWIINLISHNASADSNEDFLTSTIKNGLNIFNDNKTDNKEENNTDKGLKENKESAVNQETDKIDDKTANQETDKTNDVADNQQTEIRDTVDNNQEIAADLKQENMTDIEQKAEVDTQVIIEDLVTVREQQLLDLVNETRLHQGLQPLEIDMRLVRVARMKAEDMVTNNYFAYQSPTYGSTFDMLKANGIKYSLAGENIAAADSVEQAFTDLLNSATHKENILNPRYDKIGIGIIEGGPYRFMIVQDFIDLPNLAE